MVVAAVEHLSPIFRKANTYPQLVGEVLPGSPEGLSLHELHARAWPIVEPLFLRAQREAAARYDRLAGTGLTSQDPQDIVRAAEDGRIETLFVSQHPAGPSAAAGDVSVSDGDRGLRDVLELATVTALSKGGTVYVLPAGEVPGGGNAAAVFRHPAQAHEAIPAATTRVLG
jgi:hypothetical protein